MDKAGIANLRTGIQVTLLVGIDIGFQKGRLTNGSPGQRGWPYHPVPVDVNIEGVYIPPDQIVKMAIVTMLTVAFLALTRALVTSPDKRSIYGRFR